MHIYVVSTQSIKTQFSNERDELEKHIRTRYGNAQISIADASNFTVPSRDESVAKNTAPIIVFVQTNTDKNEWRSLINQVKYHNIFVELILVVYGGADEDVYSALTNGYFAFFEPPFNPDVLLAYIKAAQNRIKSRMDRYLISLNMSRKEKSVHDVAEQLLNDLKNLIPYDHATLVLLSKRPYFYDAEDECDTLIRTFVYSTHEHQLEWDLLCPIKFDRAFGSILREESKQRIFPNVKDDLKDSWDPIKNEHVQSLIALPLMYDNKYIALITFEGNTPGQFNLSEINEVTLSQIASQAAIAIRYTQEQEASDRLEEALKTVAYKDSLNETLNKIAEQSCILVGGLYSYIVMPDPNNPKLLFKAAWSKHYGNSFIEILKQEIEHFSLPDLKGTGHQTEIPAEAGITVLSFLNSENIIILDDCNLGHTNFVRRYLEDEYRAYRPFTYRYPEHGETKSVSTRSNVALTIVSGDGRTLGVINVDHQYPYAFTEYHLQTLKLFADVAAVAIEKSAAADRVKKLFAAIEVGTNPINVVHDDQYPENILRRLAEETYEQTGASQVKFFESVDKMTILRGWFPIHVDKTGSTNTRGEKGHTHWVITNNRPVVIGSRREYEENLRRDRGYKGKDGKLIKINPDTPLSDNALLCLPMQIRGDEGGSEVLGALWLHYTTHQNFGSTGENEQNINDEIKAFQIYANLAAFALRNYSNYELLKISEKIGQDKVTDRERAIEIIQEVIEFLKKRFDLDGVIFYELENRNRPRRLKRIAATKGHKDNPSEPFMPLGATIKKGEGLLGRHIVGKKDRNAPQNLDEEPDYRESIVIVKDYANYPHAIKKDKATGRLHAILSIRIEAPINEEKIGILILAGKKGREFDKKTKSEISRFAKQTANVLSLIRKNVPYSSTDTLSAATRLIAYGIWIFIFFVVAIATDLAAFAAVIPLFPSTLLWIFLGVVIATLYAVRGHVSPIVEDYRIIRSQVPIWLDKLRALMLRALIK